MFSVGTILSIISAALAIARYFISYAEQKKWMDAGAAAAALKGINDADNAIAAANKARADVRATNTRDPASILRDDDGFKRPD